MVMDLISEKLNLKCSLKIVILEFWKIIINGPFIPTHYVYDEEVDKLDFLWTE